MLETEMLDKSKFEICTLQKVLASIYPDFCDLMEVLYL